jgi:predicted CoA-binding protein
MAPDIAQLLTEPDTSVAVIGATDNPAKYGSVIYRDLKRKGIRVIPINPNRATVDGDPAFSDLDALTERPTILNFVVPPDRTLVVLKDALRLGYENIWLQPGAESPAVMSFIQENDFNYLANACIMVQSR